MSRFNNLVGTTELNIVRYDVNFFETFCNTRGKLPQKTVKLLNLNKKIKKMNNEQIDKFSRKIETFDKEKLQKEINRELNKLTEDNFDTIYTKVNEIYKNRSVLLEYIIENLLMKAIQQKTYIKLYVRFFEKFHTDTTLDIFKKYFNKILKTIDGFGVEDNSDYELFCKYLKDKSKFLCVFLFITELSSKKIITQELLYEYINLLKTKINHFKDDKENISLYCEIFCSMFKELGKQYIKSEYEFIKTTKTFSLPPRVKFMFMDLEDLL